MSFFQLVPEISGQIHVASFVSYRQTHAKIKNRNGGRHTARSRCVCAPCKNVNLLRTGTPLLQPVRSPVLWGTRFCRPSRNPECYYVNRDNWALFSSVFVVVFVGGSLKVWIFLLDRVLYVCVICYLCQCVCIRIMNKIFSLPIQVFRIKSVLE